MEAFEEAVPASFDLYKVLSCYKDCAVHVEQFPCILNRKVSCYTNGTVEHIWGSRSHMFTVPTIELMAVWGPRFRYR